MPSSQPPPPLSLFLCSTKHMFAAGPLIQNNTKRGQSSQQVIYCRRAAVLHTPHLLSKMRPHPPLSKIVSYSSDKGLTCARWFSVIVLFVSEMKLMGVMNASNRHLWCLRSYQLYILMLDENMGALAI